ncbi:hypothetical protein AVEN_161310-1 [Araneus ventricosus]|uniref:Mos1 transposase HTH domain-containing protein n=1 Tax=Araneus ventricosus TaxID=182803 RepID=A0A4Y1ZNN0_ARAVE|nr:hypothetical protein AVEN_124331-1 [Araneus ventricosus]GBL60550.1 hypothetical protein AVEN_161310-1 [Araneus ventricosus]
MAAPLEIRTKDEQRAVIRFLRSEGVKGSEIHRRLSSQYGESSQFRSESLTPSDQRNRITARCSSLLRTSNGATMIYLQQKEEMAELGSNFHSIITTV